MNILLADGRLVAMQYLEQHRTCAGVLAGGFGASDWTP